jgi:uncharacterized protein (TIGR03083 family)
LTIRVLDVILTSLGKRRTQEATMIATDRPTGWIDDHATWMSLATEEYRRLDDQLRSLAETDWRAATCCPGWDVHAMVAHLCGAACGNASMRESARQARLSRRYDLPTFVDRLNEVQIAERADRTPQDLIVELAEQGRAGVRSRARLPRPVRALVVPFGPPLGTKSVGYLMGRIYTRDAWMHRIDIADATGRDLHLTPEHDGVLVADVAAEWADAHGKPVRVRLTGPAGLELVRGSGGEELELDAIQFARLAAGRGSAEGLLSTPVPF